MESYGLIIRHLRKIKKLSIQTAANKIGRSVGWLSTIENGNPIYRISELEFSRIVDAMEGASFRPMFKTWIAQAKRHESISISLDGAVIKFIRLKNGMTLRQAGLILKLSIGYLSKLEQGTKSLSRSLRDRILLAYGYSPSSFKNLSSDPVRLKAVPTDLKLDIILRTLGSNQVEQLFTYLRNQRIQQSEKAL